MSATQMGRCIRWNSQKRFQEESESRFRARLRPEPFDEAVIAVHRATPQYPQLLAFLDSILGVRAIILMGAKIPLPVSAEVTNALESAEVTSDSDQGDGFQMTFKLSKGSTLEYNLIQGGRIELFNRVVLAVAFGAIPEVLIDGIITNHQLAPSNEPGESRLTVTGSDVSVMLDLEEKNEQHPNQPDWVIVTKLLANYAEYGLIPTVTPTTDVPIELFRVPRQTDTDLGYIRSAAERNGYVFYVEPVTIGVNTAYWGPENRLSLPQSALTTDMGPATNVKQLTFSNDGLAPVETEGSFLEPITKATIPIPSLPPLKIPPLAASPTPARRKVILRNSANQSPAEAAATAVSTTTRAPDAVTGNGEIDNARYGRVLRSRQLVGVRGVGLSYDGFYYVRKVTHRIRAGEYTQNFTISREGTGTLTPAVVP